MLKNNIAYKLFVSWNRMIYFKNICLFKFNIANVTFFYWIINYLNSIVSKNDLVRFEKKINKGYFDITAN